MSVGAGGVYAIPTLALGDDVWTLGGDASLSASQEAGNTGSRRLSGSEAEAGFPAAHDERLWIPTRVDRTVVAVDPLTMTVERTLHLDAEPTAATAGAGSVWVLTVNPSRVHRIDPVKGSVPRPSGSSCPPAPACSSFGAGSLWVDDPNTKSLVRLAATVPAPSARPVRAAAGVLRNGPDSEKTCACASRGSCQASRSAATDDSWLAQAPHRQPECSPVRAVSLPRNIGPRRRGRGCRGYEARPPTRQAGSSRRGHRRSSRQALRKYPSLRIVRASNRRRSAR